MKNKNEERKIECNGLWHTLTYEEYAKRNGGSYPRSCPECHSCFNPTPMKNKNEAVEELAKELFFTCEYPNPDSWEHEDTNRDIWRIRAGIIIDKGYSKTPTQCKSDDGKCGCGNGLEPLRDWDVKHPKYSKRCDDLMDEIWRTMLVGKISNYSFRDSMPIIQKYFDELIKIYSTSSTRSDMPVMPREEDSNNCSFCGIPKDYNGECCNGGCSGKQRNRPTA